MGGGVLDCGEIFSRQCEVQCSQVLFETTQLRCARYGNYPWLLGKQPGERDLSWCCVLFVRERREQVHQSLIRLPVLLLKARDAAAEVRAVEFCFRGDLAGQEPLAEGAERYESDPEFLQRRQDRLFRLPPEERILALQGGHRLNGVSAADRPLSRLGQAEMLYFAFPDQV